MNTILSSFLIVVLAVVLGQPTVVTAQTIADYTAYPPFVSQSVPPLVMLTMSKDHRLFYKAYNDIMDLDNDGAIDTTYKDTISYYGYFDSNKCYVYQNNRFEPSAWAIGANLHYCSNQWSGNFLNWATMGRIDVIRKVLYGGYRSVDTAGTDASGGGAVTVLSRTRLPRDNHSWVKVYNGSDLGWLVPQTALGLGSSVTLCNTNTSSAETSGKIMVVNGYYPYAASTEVKQCVKTFQGSGSQNFTSPLLVATYNADVLVCNTSLLESNCEKYTNTSTGNVTYKPVGLIQRQGINTQGTSDPADDVVLMKFALITGSYGANFSGGVLRSNIVDVNNEINSADGTVKTSTSKIIANIDKFKIVGYNYSTGYYNLGGVEGTCTTSTPSDGACKSWGNPIAEMYYEAIRFFKGLSGPTAEFKRSPPDYSSAPLTVESSWVDPYSTCPYCAKPFVLVFSDTFPSFDSNQLPGSYWSTPISTSDTPSVQTLIDNAGMNTLEAIGNVLVGQSGATYDRSCTSKPGDFKSIRGLCVEEPTKQGSYYLAGLAHYAKTTDLRPDKTGDQKITTYAVATNAPIPVLDFTVGGQKLQLVPIFHDGCPATTGYAGCTAIGQYGDATKGSLADFKYCDSDTDWTTEQGNGYTSCFDILWDDSEFGQDYDLDIRYRIYLKPGAGTVEIKTKGIYAQAGHTNYAGYFITGVSGAGEYFEIRCGGSLAGTADCDQAVSGNETAVTTRTFTVTGSITGFLKDPLWYAAKYGGFEDKDGDNQPNLSTEWDKDGNGVPDTYFYAANPLELEAKLAEAFAAILNRASSGTAASVLASSTTGEGALYQSFFFPTQFESTREIKWTGYTQGLFVDTFGNLREDSNGDGKLVYSEDNIIVTRYDTASTTVKVDRYVDADGNGKADSTTPTATVTLTEIKPIWEAGKQLALTTSSARKIFTWTDQDGDKVVDTGEFIEFKTANSAILAPYLRAGSAPYTADNIINFIRGDQISGLRDRQLTVAGTLKVWKLGDSVYATPVIVGAPRERYDVIYGDASYTDYFVKYRNRRQVAYVGANDGMLHAFNVGFYHRGDDPATATKTEHGYFTETPTGNTNTPPIFGNELWGFIPQELLPHLRWLAQPDYTHVYYVDLKPKVTDARIFTPDTDHPNGWGTILIGGFRMGGSCGNCTTQGKPMTVTADFGSGIEARAFYSAYFVLDITNPEVDPKLLWVFSDADLGLTTSVPAVLRVNPSTSAKTDNTNAKWYAIFGSGPTNYDAGSAQSAKLFVVNLATGATVANPAAELPVGSWTSFIGDPITVDRNLDYRVDVAYMGRVINDGSMPWRGKLYRLTTDCATGVCPTDASGWGIASGSDRVPTEILDTFVDGSSTTRELGPIVAAPVAAIDDSNMLWIFAGTGRYYGVADKTDTSTQYLFGVKDSVLNGTCSGGQTSVTSCLDDDLVDVSSAQVCVVSIGTCTAANQVSGVAGVSTYPSLIALVKSKDGWFTTLPGTGERMVATPAVLGGVVLFPTFVPDSDVCVASGNSYLYALYYVTGGAYSEAVIGTTTLGSNQVVNRSASLGQGLATTVALHIGAQGSGGAGGGSQSGLTGCSQSSTGALNCINLNPVLGVTSRYLSWVNQRD